jgi:pilus assembly protein CpaB
MRTRIIAVIVAAVLAIAGATALVFAVQGASQSAAAGTRTQTVLVVVTEIPLGMTGEAAAALVEEQKIPAAYIADGAVDSVKDLLGLVAAAPLLPGEQVLADRWSTPADLVATGGRVDAPDGTQEMSIALELERVAGGAVVPGSRVGVWASVDDATTLLFDQVLVTALASTVDAEEDGASTHGTVLVTFAVSEVQAQAIIHAAEFGEIWLSLQEQR